MKKNQASGRYCMSGTVAVPLFLMISGVVLLMNNFGMVHVDRMWDLWPLLLIAIGVEQVLSWTRGERV